MHTSQLVPAKGAHGLKFCVVLERDDRLFKPPLPDQYQSEAVPSAVHLFLDRNGGPKTAFGILKASQLFAHKGLVEMSIRGLGGEGGI